MPQANGPGERKKRERVPGSVRHMKELEREQLEELRNEARARLLKKAQVKLTPELVVAIVSGVMAGNYASVVARANGVDSATYRRWIEDGKEAWMNQQIISEADPLGLRAELYLLTEQADAEWEVGTVAQMKEHIEKGTYWAGHMTLLQRRHPERWDARGRSSGDDTKTIEEQLREWSAQRQSQMRDDQRTATTGESDHH